MNRRRGSGNLTEKVQKIFKNHPYTGFTVKTIIKKLGKKRITKAEVKTSVQTLLKKNIIYQHRDGRYFFTADTDTQAIKKTQGVFVEGIVDLTSKGSAFILVDDLPDDVYIAPRFVNRAFDGDLVKVRLNKSNRRGRKEGEIVEIIRRRQEEFAGIVDMQEKFAFIIMDRKKVPVDFYVKGKNLKNAKDGDKVIVKLIGWPANQKSPYGDIINVLGQEGEHDAEMKAIIVENGFPLKFPKKVMDRMSRLSMEIPQEEIDKRIDFRKVTTVTIDPHDAKDFDDALSIQKLDNGNWEIGVHIADVSHYIQEGTIEDKEAVMRSTSVYLVDRVVPMFPEHLSNLVCSLRPNEDKLCFSVIFEVDEEAKIVNRKFARTVIHSVRRYTYAEAQEIIETGEGDYKEEILTMFRLSQKIRQRRMAKGAIRFDRPEIKFELDETGKPIGTYLKVQKESNNMIEDYMLMANEAVAMYFTKYNIKNQKAPGVYRTHAPPEAEKLEKFQNMAAKFGHKLIFSNPEQIAKSINGILAKVQEKPEQNLIETLAIRTMSKAEYTTNNIGHYGLAMPDYTHFTSPIRRYPDVMVHRQLQRMMDNEPEMDKDGMDSTLKHCSTMEKNAMNAERESTKYKQVEFLSDKLGDEFIGVISGVQNYGIFVELEENHCEGLVRTESITHDRFIFAEDEYALMGMKTGQKYRLGDKLKIVVVAADLKNRTVDFEIVQEKKG